MSRRLRTAMLSVLVTAAMVGTGSAAVAASPTPTGRAVTAADRNPGGHEAHNGGDSRRGGDARQGDEGRRDDGGRDVHRGDTDRHSGVHGDRRDHRDMDHGRWYGRDWDHRGGSWYGWSWEQQCEWAWYNDPAWYDEYCA